MHGDHYFGKAASPTATAAGFVVHGGRAFGGTDAISPMGNISYQWTDDLMTYFRISRGFTGGGFNPGAPLPVLFTTFDPETLWAFESGIKSQWLDNRLRVNMDGFFSYYNDLQDQYTPRRDLFLADLDRARLSYIRPQGAYYALVDISPFGFTDDSAYYGGLLAFKFRRFLDAMRKRWQWIRHAEALERYARIEHANVRASRAYILRPFPGTLHLFRYAVLQARYEGNVPANGWADVGVKELVVHPLSCYHGNVLFEPFVSEVARVLNESLE